MSISERCGCGATIDTVPGLDITTARQIASHWRRTHRHDPSVEKPEEDGRKPMGFNTSAVSHDSGDGEGDDEWQGMYASPADVRET